jgi:hypothetical protein
MRIDRIMRTEEKPDAIVIETTDVHLPDAIGEALHDAFQRQPAVSISGVKLFCGSGTVNPERLRLRQPVRKLGQGLQPGLDNAREACSNGSVVVLQAGNYFPVERRSHVDAKPTHNCGWFGRLIQGRDAAQVLRHAPCRILIVRQEEHDFVATD